QGAAPRLLHHRLRLARGGPRHRPRPRGRKSRRRLRGQAGRDVLAGKGRRHVTDLDWIEAALTAARPRTLAALVRYFHDLDAAEEAVQNACLRALQTWAGNGPARDPAAWLILVGRNSAVDTLRRGARQVPLPDEETVSDVEDAEAALVERLDEAHYRDDILRLLFVCCHPDLP